MNNLTPSGLRIAAVFATTLGITLSSGQPLRAQTWTSLDVRPSGTTIPAGSDSYNSTTGLFTVSGAGSDIGAGTSDGFRFIYQSVTNDAVFQAKVESIQTSNTDSHAKAGIMLRQDLTPGSIEAMNGVTPTSGVGLLWHYRTIANGGGTNLYTAGLVAPYWVRLVKDGGLISSFRSSDGTNWSFTGVVRLTLSGPVDVGLAVTSHSTAKLCAATFDNVSLVTQANFAPPTPWVDQDIGVTGTQNGGVHFESDQWSLFASGADIFGAADAFHYVYQPITGDCSIIAQVSGLSNVNGWAKAGVMIRANLNPGSPNAFLATTPTSGGATNGTVFQTRLPTGTPSAAYGDGGATTSAVSAVTGAPSWLKLIRSGNQFYAYLSADGTTWQQSAVQTINMPASVFVGLAATSHLSGSLVAGFYDSIQVGPPVMQVNSKTDTGVNFIWPSLANPSSVALYRVLRDGVQVGTSTTTNFSDIQLTPNTTYSYSVQALDASNNVLATSATLSVTTASPYLASPWTHLDIGSVLLGGSTIFESSTQLYKMQASGADITGTADQFQFAEQPLTGNGQIVAQVNTLSNTNGWTKAGIMLRESTAPGSRFAMITLTPSNGVNFESRSATGAPSTLISGGPAAVLIWLKLIRQGTTVTGYTSPDGANWTLVGSATLANDAGIAISPVEAGLVLTSHSVNTLASASFANVNVTAGIPTTTLSPTVPAGLAVDSEGDVSAKISWKASTDPVGVNYYSVYQNGVHIFSGPGLSFTVLALPYGESIGYTVRAISLSGHSSAQSAPLTVTPLPYGMVYPWVHQEFGNIVLPGMSTTTDGIAFTASASGDDIFGGSDSFGFTYVPLSGNGEIATRVASLSNTNPWAKVGVMIRQTLDATSPYAALFVTPSNGLTFQNRDAIGDTTHTHAGPLLSTPVWVRLVRNGSILTGYSSTNGTDWNLVAQVTNTSLPSTIYAGLAITSHTNSLLNTATFDGLETIGMDSDYDGLPDAWEIAHGLDPTNSDQNNNGIPDGQDDFDGDGVTNLQEYLDGTDPLDSTSVHNPPSAVTDTTGATGLEVYTVPTYENPNH